MIINSSRFSSLQVVQAQGNDGPGGVPGPQQSAGDGALPAQPAKVPMSTGAKVGVGLTAAGLLWHFFL